MQTLGRHYYIFGMRQKVIKYIRGCAACLVSNHFRGTRDEPGMQSPMDSGISVACDMAGPFNNAGQYKYIFCLIDQFSRYAFCYPTKSTQDSDVVECLMEVRKEWGFLPRRLHCDRALCSKFTISSKVCEWFGVELTHSMAANSRCQSKVERFIGTITRLILKMQSAAPNIQFHQLVTEARTCYNNTSTDVLNGASPSSLHFFRQGANLVDIDGRMPLDGVTNPSKSVADALIAKRAAHDEVLKSDVRRFQRRKEDVNPRDPNTFLQVGDLCLKKRTSFFANAPKKIQSKVDEDAFEITGKIATNSYRTTSIVDGRQYVHCGDHLVRSHLDRPGLLRLIERLKLVRLAFNAPQAARPNTRSRNVVDAIPPPPYNVSYLFR